MCEKRSEFTINRHDNRHSWSAQHVFCTWANVENLPKCKLPPVGDRWDGISVQIKSSRKARHRGRNWNLRNISIPLHLLMTPTTFATSCWRYPSSFERNHVMWVMHLTSNLQYNHGSQERKGVDFRYAILVSNTHNLLNKSSPSSSSLMFIVDRCTGREIGSLSTEARYTQACYHSLHWGLVDTWYGLRYSLIFALSLWSPPLSLSRP